MKNERLPRWKGMILVAALGCLFAGQALAQTAPNRVWTAPGHASTVTSVAFSPDGTLMISGSFDRTLKLWRIADGT
ncbi:MAG: hypothetical protein EPO07_05485, partial [Verrucomicrobia bacterium]